MKEKRTKARGVRLMGQVTSDKVKHPGSHPRLLLLSALASLVLGSAACRQVVVERVVVPEPTGERTSYADVISNVSPSVVSVYTRTLLTGKSAAILTNSPSLKGLLEKGEHSSKGTPHEIDGLGSGVVIASNGYILTSAHVVEDADEITVTTSSGDDLKATVVGSDPATDVAVLKVAAMNLRPAKMADSNKLRVGDVVLAIGNPFGVGQTVTSGIVSATERAGFGITDYEDFIQTDAPINPGNSGGALIDAQGRVIGINSAILTRGGGSEGIGLAVPSNLARNAMEQIISHGRVIRGFLGVSLTSLTAELAKAAHIPASKGALVLSVAPDSPAAKAGLREGDIILEANGTPVANSRELRLRIAQTTPGNRLKMQLLRVGKRKELAATLVEAPAPKAKPTEHGLKDSAPDDPKDKQG